MDLFYYGSQDIPPPLGARGSRRPEGPTDGSDRACEACNAVVTPEDLAEGKASEIYGVVLCAACGGGEEARPENRVELYFCDRCHVSVPVYRVDTGEALAGDGRILCLDCRAGGRRRKGPGRGVFTLVALLLAGAGVLLFGALLDRRPDLPDQTPILESLDHRLEELSALLGDGSADREMVEVLTALEKRVDGSEGRLRDLEEASREIDRLRAEYERRTREREGDTGSLSRQLDGLLSEVEPGPAEAEDVEKR